MEVPYALTPSDVLNLRCSMRGPRPPDGTHGSLPPFIVWLPSDRTYALHHYGVTMATGPLHVLGACLRAERAETGFIRRVCESLEPPDLASLAPDERQRFQALAREEERKRTAYAAELATSAARRASLIDVSKINLEDLE